MTSSVSDFPKAVARVSEGFCPICDGELRDLVTIIDAPDDSAGETTEPGYCEACAVRWWLDTSLGTDRPALRTDRALTKDEIRKLYDREAGAASSGGGGSSV